MAAILVFQNNETAAMFVYQDNPMGVEFFSYAMLSFVPMNCIDAGHESESALVLAIKNVRTAGLIIIIIKIDW